MKLTTALFCVALCAPALAQSAPPDPNKVIKLLSAPQRAVRMKALPLAPDISISLQNKHQRAQVTAALLSWLSKESDPGVRSQVANGLSDMLHYAPEGTAVASDYARSARYLEDPDRDIRHGFWLAFDGHTDLLARPLLDHLLSLVDSPRPELRLDAFDWLNSSQTSGGQKQPYLAKQAPAFPRTCSITARPSSAGNKSRPAAGSSPGSATTCTSPPSSPWPAPWVRATVASSCWFSA